MEPEQLTPISAGLKRLPLTFAPGWSFDDAEYVLDRIASQTIDTTGLVTATVSLAELPDMFETLKQPNTHCKVLVTPG